MLKKKTICILLAIVSVMALPPVSASAAAIQAKPTASSVILNGDKISFEAYNINGNNYFKLRDLAKALNGGSKQFEVTWDAANNAVGIKTGHGYTPAGGELTLSGNTAVKSASASNSRVTVDGIETPLAAYLIDGNNYFKLRDLGTAIGFQVAYDETANAVIINSDFIQYKNTTYGFNFTLPKSWENYSIVTDQWAGYLMTVEDVDPEAGPLIKIRNPQWTDQTPRQDIPIMIFTLAQWNRVQKEELSVSAAPIPPSELGRNSKYVFALPARYNYAFPQGFEEVESILADSPLQPIKK